MAGPAVGGRPAAGLENRLQDDATKRNLPDFNSVSLLCPLRHMIVALHGNGCKMNTCQQLQHIC